MTTSEAMIWLGTKQLELYKSNPGSYVDAFCNGLCMRRIMTNYYQIMTRRGKLLYIEILNPEVKTELKKMAIEFSAKRLDADGCMDLCKLLHIISNVHN